MTTISVPFHGEGAGVGELTWGQKHIWTAMRDSGSSLSMSAIRALAEGARLDEFVDELRFFMSRFQPMRTRLCFPVDDGRLASFAGGDGGVMQEVYASGEALLEIVDIDAGTDAAKAAEALSQRHVDTPFDYANEWPLRMALVRQDGVLTHLVTTLCHIAADATGAFAMFMDLLRRDPVTGEPGGPVAGLQPLELARMQREPAARRQSDAALRHWEEVLRTMAPRRFADPVDRGEPRYRQLGYTSPAMHLGLRVLGARLRLDAAPMLLAAFAIALTRVNGRNPVVAQLIGSNRFRPGFAEIVSPVNQTGLCSLFVADMTIAEAMLVTKRRSITAYKYAYYDPDDLDVLLARVRRERGDLDRSVVYNDRRPPGPPPDPGGPVPSEAEIRAVADAGVLRWERLDQFKGKLMLNVNNEPDTVDLMAQADTRYLSTEDIDALLRGVESVVIEATLDPSAPTGVGPGPVTS